MGIVMLNFVETVLLTQHITNVSDQYSDALLILFYQSVQELGTYYINKNGMVKGITNVTSYRTKLVPAKHPNSSVGYLSEVMPAVHVATPSTFLHGWSRMIPSSMSVDSEASYMKSSLEDILHHLAVQTSFS